MAQTFTYAAQGRYANIKTKWSYEFCEVRFKCIPNTVAYPHHLIFKHSLQTQHTRLDSFWYIDWNYMQNFSPLSLFRLDFHIDFNCLMMTHRMYWLSEMQVSQANTYVHVYGNWAIVLKLKLSLIEDRKKRRKSTQVYRLNTILPRSTYKKLAAYCWTRARDIQIERSLHQHVLRKMPFADSFCIRLKSRLTVW